MTIRSLVTLVAAIVVSAASSVAHANSALAVSECQVAVQSDARFNGARDATVQQINNHSYKVTGKVKDQKGRDHSYTCRYEHDEVVSYSVGEPSMSDADKQRAAAVGAGLLGLVAVAAIAAHEDDDDNHRKYRNSYNNGEANAFDDRNFLQRECSHEIRAHIDRDHGKVASIDLQSPRVHNRVMSGRGEVYFRNGGSRELNYYCNFDRSGRIYDGSYSYVGAGYPGHSGYSTYDYDGNRGGGSSEYKRGFNDGRRGNEFDSYRHPQDYKDGYRDGERTRWDN